jgi:hypothetical protein
MKCAILAGIVPLIFGFEPQYLSSISAATHSKNERYSLQAGRQDECLKRHVELSRSFD